MTKPTVYLVRMVVFLVGVAIVATLLSGPLLGAFQGNPLLNALILSILALGIGWNLRQVQRLTPGSDVAGNLAERARPCRRPALAQAAGTDGQHARRPRSRRAGGQRRGEGAPG